MGDKATVVISTYNGEKYLSELLDSVLNQKKVELNIYIRDDGSTDQTKNIIISYLKTNKNITAEFGDNLGYAKSFWSMLKVDDGSDYYAYCDQDDIWDTDKLSEAIKMIREDDFNGPVLYTSCVRSINNRGEILSENCFGTSEVIDIYESFQRSIIPGCVFVFNRKAKDLLSIYDGCLESHDWASYAIISVFGKIIYDDRSFINYRIHENNVIGKSNKWREILIKIKRLSKKSSCFRSRFAKDFLTNYEEMLSDELVKNNIRQLACYHENIKLKIRLLFNKNFKGIIFRVYIILNRV